MRSTRQRMVDAIEERPGIHKSLLRRELGLGWGTVLHHARTLRQAGQVQEYNDGWRTRLYPPGHPAPAALRQAALDAEQDAPQDVQPDQEAPAPAVVLARGSQRGGERSRSRILEAVRTRPGITKIELCRLLGLAWGTVDYHVRLLTRCDLLRAHRFGRAVSLFPSSMPERHVRWLLALADATRLEVARSLAAGEALEALPRAVGVGRRQIRNHLKVLRDAGILVGPSLCAEARGLVACVPDMDRIDTDRWSARAPEVVAEVP